MAQTSPALDGQVFGILFEHGTEALFTVHRQSRMVLTANHQLEELVGRSRLSLIGRGADELFAESDDADWTSRILERAGLHEEVALRRLDGYAVYVSVTVAHIDHATLGPLAACIARDTTERRILERELIAKHAALYTAHAELEAAFRRLRETQERLEERNRELTVMGTQLARAAHRAAIGEFSAGIAHSMNNPMGALSSALRQLEKRVLDSSDQALKESSERFLKRAQHALSRMETIVGSVRRAHRSGHLESRPQALVIADEAHTALSLFDGRLRGIEVDVQADCDTRGWVPPDALHHVLSNLIDNAIRQLADGGRLTLRFGREDGRVTISVIDDGAGVPDDFVAQLFEPFVTSSADGTGLGLCLSRRLARQWGGDVVYVAGETGARFDVYIPTEEPSWREARS